MSKEELNKKAEEAAREVYTYTFQGMDDLIGLFLAGYKLAEKDLALTPNDIDEIVHIYEVRKSVSADFDEEFYEDILNEYKRRKNNETLLLRPPTPETLGETEKRTRPTVAELVGTRTKEKESQ